MRERSCRGTDLQTQRESMGLSQEDVNRKLRIPLDFIQQIEADELPEVSANTYTIGFAKTYCAFLGRSPEAYIAQMRPLKGPPKGLIHQASEAIHAERTERPAWMAEAMMWASIVGIIVLGWAAYALVIQPKTSDVDNNVSADTVETRDFDFPSR